MPCRPIAAVAILLAWVWTVTAAETVYVGVAGPGSRSFDKIDHSPWDSLLSRFVDVDGRVDYRGWKNDPKAVRELDDYLGRLSSAGLKLKSTRQARLAFWINAYNAVTVRGILREYPTSSIRNHTARLWGYNIWKHLKLRVDNAPFSLDQIEHEILRKMSEPRIHFAIVCASIGCPRLRNEAYVPDRLEEQLDQNAKDFFSRSQNFRHDVANRRFQLSAILDWFGEDFGGGQAALLRRISGWLPTPSAREAAASNAVRVDFLSYDWNLNSQ